MSFTKPGAHSFCTAEYWLWKRNLPCKSRVLLTFWAGAKSRLQVGKLPASTSSQQPRYMCVQHQIASTGANIRCMTPLHAFSQLDRIALPFKHTQILAGSNCCSLPHLHVACDWIFVALHAFRQIDITLQFFNITATARAWYCMSPSSKHFPLNLHLSVCMCEAGALRQALLIGYDHPRMEGLWPSDKLCPGFK